jgi:hypothetical protein
VARLELANQQADVLGCLRSNLGLEGSRRRGAAECGGGES